MIALFTKVLLLVEQGRPEAAEALARVAPIPAALERLPFVACLCQGQAAAQLAQRKHRDAAQTLARVGAVCDANGMHSPTMYPWRSQLALALAGGERHDEGIELARAELQLAERNDVDRARGVALRALGMLEGGEAGLRRLEASVQSLERSPARLELGWASYELGAALRRAKRRRDARTPLDRALDIALACGAELLSGRASEELRALAARSRSIMRSGAESLTPSERRVCRLAAQGLKNGEIAQALFVTLKTVETHCAAPTASSTSARGQRCPRPSAGSHPESGSSTALTARAAQRPIVSTRLTKRLPFQAADSTRRAPLGQHPGSSGR